MRINKFVAQATGLSRRAADSALTQGRIEVNGHPAQLGYAVRPDDQVTLDSRSICITAVKTTTIMLNKPAGYICSRAGQGSKTIYDLLPQELHHLKPVGRLDKDSSGLLLLTNDGQLANELTHPRFQKEKVYEVELDRPLAVADKSKIERGVELVSGRPSGAVETYVSRLRLSAIDTGQKPIATRCWQVAISSGRNRQIRRTFAASGYEVKCLRRIQFGIHILRLLPPGQWETVV